MKVKTFFIIFVVLLIANCGFSAVGNPIGSPVGSPVSSPVGSSTTPPTTFRSGLHRNNPYDYSSNNVVTGNVGGGKHFRGEVPYNAITDFGGRLGTTDLESFLRYSSGGGGISTPPGTYRPFYTPRESVTSIRYGGGGVSTGLSGSVTTRDEDRVFVPSNSRYLEDFDRPKLNLSLGGIDRDKYLEDQEFGQQQDDLNFRLYRNEAEESEKKNLDEAAAEHIAETEVLLKQNDEQMLKLKTDLDDMSKKIAELKDKVQIEKSNELLLENVEEPPKPIHEQPEAEQNPLMEQLETDELVGDNESLDKYQKMGEEIESLQSKIKEQLEQLKLEEENARELETDTQEEKEQTDKYRSDRLKIKSAGETVSDLREAVSENLSGIDLSLKAQSIMQKEKNFDSYTARRYKVNMEKAKKYLHSGKYYIADDIFKTAQVFKPDDVLAIAGRGHALLAAGEYMSSALFISRALKSSPQYAEEKVDLAAEIGNKDVVENRVLEIEEWAERNSVPELKFLLAYTYYRLGRNDEASREIESVYEAMQSNPDKSKAVAILREAINKAK